MPQFRHDPPGPGRLGAPARFHEDTMMKTIRIVAAPLALAALVSAGHAAERSETPARYTWDLTALYPSNRAWQTAKTGLEKRVGALGAFQGHVADSDAALLEALDAIMDVSKDMQRLYTYASQLSDQDARVAAHQEMKQAAQQLYVRFGSTISYVRPEILAAGEKKIRAFQASNRKLAPYRVYLADILRAAPHTLDGDGEKLVAQAARMSSAAGEIRSLFATAEFPYPKVTLSNGETVTLDQAGYSLHRTAANRADRMKVFEAFWNEHKKYRGTFGAALYEQIKAHMFTKEVRKFDSCLEAATFGDNIPPRVYHQLIADVNAQLPTFHRYLKLRKRMLGVDSLRYQDLYAPVVKEVDQKYTPEQATEIVLAAVAPLGKDYVETLRKGLTTERWTDWLPNTGKQGGAYSTGAYGVHPYQLQNFTGLYDEVGTLAHESGHSMHTFLAQKHQPYVTSDYATFVAEVASTLNENLLFHYMLDRTTDRDARLYLLGSYLDNLRGTLFRQTQFAEFELRIHELAEKGETLSGEGLTKLYLDITRRYYGHAKGICRVDDVIGTEWAWIDHFFYNFYVYQYATSIVAATTLANAIHEEARRSPNTHVARDRYLAMLQSGSSKFPIDLLKDAGVDMTTSAPFKAAIKEMNSVMDEIEKTLAEKPKRTLRTTGKKG
jgi:oligoendopeptidase F